MTPAARKLILTTAAIGAAALFSACGAQTQTQAVSSPAPVIHTQTAAMPDDSDLVLIKDYIPSICAELKYASADNFTGTAIYGFTQPSLRYGTVKKLAAVQSALNEQGLSLKIWDAYRPVSAQYKLWSICPDPRYVADPANGGSKHCRGNTVDLTIIDKDGAELEMPSDFDDFSAKADRDYSDVSTKAAENARLLERLMTDNGFVGYQQEWWHFYDSNDYPVIDE